VNNYVTRSARRLIPTVAALIGTFVFHRYTLLTGFDRVQADTGDSRFIAFLLEHWNNVLHGAADWRSPPIFWPVKGTLAYSDGLVAMALLHAAFRTFLSVFVAINLQLVLLTLATFAGTYWMLRRGFGQAAWGAAAGAWFFAFSWPRFAQLVHLQLQFTPLLPLAVLMVLECCRDGLTLTPRSFAWRGMLFVAMLGCLLATTVYYAVFLALTLGVAGLICLFYGPARDHLFAVVRVQFLNLLACGAVGVVLAAPIVAFYARTAGESGGRSWEEVRRQLPDLAHLFWMGSENWIWGWAFAWLPGQVLLENWAEFRIGVGAVASVAWCVGVLWVGWTVFRCRTLDRRTGLIVLAIGTGVMLQFLMLSWPGGYSAWWAVWWAFPGANGLRAISRLELVVTLEMSVWFSFLVNAGVRAGRPFWLTLTACLVLLAGIEQIGRIESYSGHSAEALSRRVAAALSPSCRASYVVASSEQVGAWGDIDEAHFNAAAYLAANPDVAAAWHGSAWEHYRLFGRAEHRSQDPSAARRRLMLLFHGYNYTIPLAAALARRPVVNGLSGWEPPGWQLFDVLSPDAPEKLAAWLSLQNQPPGSVCLVPVRITIDMVPYVPSAMWPFGVPSVNPNKR
jgi:hypothetical protein